MQGLSSLLSYRGSVLSWIRRDVLMSRAVQSTSRARPDRVCVSVHACRPGTCPTFFDDNPLVAGHAVSDFV